VQRAACSPHAEVRRSGKADAGPHRSRPTRSLVARALVVLIHAVIPLFPPGAVVSQARLRLYCIEPRLDGLSTRAARTSIIQARPRSSLT
jgi:hypothetical protein